MSLEVSVRLVVSPSLCGANVAVHLSLWRDWTRSAASIPGRQPLGGFVEIMGSPNRFLASVVSFHEGNPDAVYVSKQFFVSFSSLAGGSFGPTGRDERAPLETAYRVPLRTVRLPKAISVSLRGNTPSSEVISLLKAEFMQMLVIQTRLPVAFANGNSLDVISIGAEGAGFVEGATFVDVSGVHVTLVSPVDATTSDFRVELAPTFSPAAVLWFTRCMSLQSSLAAVGVGAEWRSDYEAEEKKLRPRLPENARAAQQGEWTLRRTGEVSEPVRPSGRVVHGTSMTADVNDAMASWKKAFDESMSQLVIALIQLKDSALSAEVSHFSDCDRTDTRPLSLSSAPVGTPLPVRTPTCIVCGREIRPGTDRATRCGHAHEGCALKVPVCSICQVYFASA